MDVVFLDTETTDSGEGMRMIQLAYREYGQEYINELYNPEVPISFGAMAVHNIKDEVVADKPTFQESGRPEILQELLEKKIMVAHNAPFDMSVLKIEGIETHRYIDTLKVARSYIQHDIRGAELGSYSLQYLRYALGLDDESATAHDALGDIIILENLFEKLIELVQGSIGALFSTEMVLEKMMEISKQPTLLRRIRFGKYRGKRFEEIDRSYLEWLSKQSDLDPDLVYTLKYYLGNRE